MQSFFAPGAQFGYIITSTACPPAAAQRAGDDVVIGVDPASGTWRRPSSSSAVGRAVGRRERTPHGRAGSIGRGTSRGGGSRRHARTDRVHLLSSTTSAATSRRPARTWWCSSTSGRGSWQRSPYPLAEAPARLPHSGRGERPGFARGDPVGALSGDCGIEHVVDTGRTSLFEVFGQRGAYAVQQPRLIQMPNREECDRERDCQARARNDTSGAPRGCVKRTAQTGRPPTPVNGQVEVPPVATRSPYPQRRFQAVGSSPPPGARASFMR